MLDATPTHTLLPQTQCGADSNPPFLGVSHSFFSLREGLERAQMGLLSWDTIGPAGATDVETVVPTTWAAEPSVGWIFTEE